MVREESSKVEDTKAIIRREFLQRHDPSVIAKIADCSIEVVELEIEKLKNNSN